MLRPNRALLPGALLCSILLGACGGATAEPSTADPAAGLSVTYENVSLAQNVATVDEKTTRDALVAIEDDGTLHFRADAAGSIADLKPGQPLVLGGGTVRTVGHVEREGDEIVIATTDADLGDIIQDGTIGWDYAIDWDDLPAATYETAAVEAGLSPMLASADGVPPAPTQRFQVRGKELKFAGHVKGFEIELKFVPKAGQLDFEISAKRANVKVQAAGFLSQFSQSTEMTYDNGTGTFFDAGVKGLKGEATVEWSAFQVEDTSMNNDIVALELPLKLPIPFMIGPVPMTLNIKMNLRVVPDLNSGDASSGGSFKLTYNSDHGFSSNGGSVNPAAKLHSLAADLAEKPTVTAGLGVVGFGFGMEFPRLELALGHPAWPELELLGSGWQEGAEAQSKLLNTYAFLTMNQYAAGLWTPGTTLSSDIPPCQSAYIKISAIAGYKLSVLGMAELSDTTLLWEKQIDKYKDGKPCTLTGE
jgi:hypothetical protein